MLGSDPNIVNFRLKGTGKYLKVDEVEISTDESGKKPRDVAREKSSGNPVVIEWEKMSKSKHNGVDPNLVRQSNLSCEFTGKILYAEIPGFGQVRL